MRIVNKTHWSTRDMRRIMTRVAREELNDTDAHRALRKQLVVTVVYSRSGSMSGCAWRGRPVARICVQKRVKCWSESRGDYEAKALNSVEFAWLCAHEFAHVRGQRHRTMNRNVMYFTNKAHEMYEWAREFPIHRVEPKTKTREEKRDAKLLHAQRMLARAETRAKRAATLLRKWRQKVKYYERQQVLAAGTTK